MNQCDQQEDWKTPQEASLSSSILTTSTRAQDAEIDDQSSSIYYHERSPRRRRSVRWFLGSGLFAIASLVLLIRYHAGFQWRCNGSGRGISCASSIIFGPHLVAWLPSRANGIMNYLRLFQISNYSSETASIRHQTPQANRSKHGHYRARSPHRHLLGGSDSNAFRYPQLVVAGKMTVEDGPCNIAQYNLKTHAWSLTERIQLSLYNSYSGGEVYSLLANHTFLPMVDSEDVDDDSSRR